MNPGNILISFLSVTAIFLAAATLAGAEDATRALPPRFVSLKWGEVKPSGWIKEQMRRDLREGFAGRLDQLCPEAGSDIFATGRNRPGKPNMQGQNLPGTRPLWYYNGETEGNWRTGFFMLAYLSEEPEFMRKADEYVARVLFAQDEDGYIGINSPELRYRDKGELWTQACLLRGLLPYAELAGKPKVARAVAAAAAQVMQTLSSGTHELAWTQTHDLMFCDVLEQLFETTGDRKYVDFATWLYGEFNKHKPEEDGALPALLHAKQGFSGHGVHTFEHMRVPLWLWRATGQKDYGRAWQNAFEKLQRYTYPGGCAVSQEKIEDLTPHPTETFFEYCNVRELLVDMNSAFQKTGDSRYAERAELLFLNDAQGARLADGSAVGYLNAENRLRCDAKSWDGKEEQPRNKLSPTHQDVAVCCNPNATQVAPHYVRGMWLAGQKDELVCALYGPSVVNTRIKNVDVAIEEKTDFPFDYTVEIAVSPASDVEFSLLLRDPDWSRSTSVKCPGGTVKKEPGFWRVRKKWKKGDVVRIVFGPAVRTSDAANGETVVHYGPLVFARPLPGKEISRQTYVSQLGFSDTSIAPDGPEQEVVLDATSGGRADGFGFKPRNITERTNRLRPWDAPLLVLDGEMLDPKNGQRVKVTLEPLGNANKLRRVTFPAGK